MTKWSSEEIELLKEKYPNPLISHAELEKLFNRKIKAITQIAIENNIKRFRKHKSYNFPLSDEEIIRLYEEEKYNVADLTKICNCDRRYIYRIFKRNKTKLRNRNESIIIYYQNRIEPLREIILQLYVKDELPLGTIAKQLHYNVRRVRNCLKSENINLRTLSETIKNIYIQNGDEIRNKHRLARLNQKIKQKDTSIEIKIREQLIAHEIEFEQQYNIGNRFEGDFYIPDLNLIVEADGEYWHGFEEAIERDKRKNIFIFEKGFNLLRLKESIINSNTFDINNFLINKDMWLILQ